MKENIKPPPTVAINIVQSWGTKKHISPGTSEPTFPTDPLNGDSLESRARHQKSQTTWTSTFAEKKWI